METDYGSAESLNELWRRVFEIARRETDIPTVWLALQSIRPLGIDASYFVASLPPDMRYLGINLQSAEVSAIIEEALQKETGRILAFRLIAGDTLADWEVEKQRELAAPRFKSADPPKPSAAAPTAQRASSEPRIQGDQPDREVFQSWEKLNEALQHKYKAAPMVKFPQGQARYLVGAVQMISDTMDVMMPAADQPRDELQERALAKTLDRVGSLMGNLDSLFIALELMRQRQMEGKDIGI